MGMGLMFTTVDPKYLRTLERWIGEITGDVVPDDGEEEQEVPSSRRMLRRLPRPQSMLTSSTSS